MTSPNESPTIHLSGRRPRLSVARDVLVAALCAILVLGFIFAVDRDFGAHRPPAERTARLSS